MARANIMMWLASTGNVILAKGFLRFYGWRSLPRPAKSETGAAGGQARAPSREDCAELRGRSSRPGLPSAWAEGRTDRDVASPSAARSKGLSPLASSRGSVVARGNALPS